MESNNVKSFLTPFDFEVFSSWQSPVIRINSFSKLSEKGGISHTNPVFEKDKFSHLEIMFYEKSIRQKPEKITDILGKIAESSVGMILHEMSHLIELLWRKKKFQRNFLLPDFGMSAFNVVAFYKYEPDVLAINMLLLRQLPEKYSNFTVSNRFEKATEKADKMNLEFIYNIWCNAMHHYSTFVGKSI